MKAQLKHADIPFINLAVQLAQDGYTTSAANRNWESFGKNVMLPKNMPNWQQNYFAIRKQVVVYWSVVLQNMQTR